MTQITRKVERLMNLHYAIGNNSQTMTNRENYNESVLPTNVKECQDVSLMHYDS